MPKVYVYTIVTDAGFAPNPYGSYLTLATCKPIIRKLAQVGDIIIAHHTKSRGGGVCYVMEITEIMTQNQYYNDLRFQYKIPTPTNPIGDNCYRPIGNGEYEQLPCQHRGCDQEKDLNGLVLISENFTYWGDKSIESIQPQHELPEWIPRAQRGYRVNNNDKKRIDCKRTLEWIAELPKGKLGEPSDKPKGKCSKKNAKYN